MIKLDDLLKSLPEGLDLATLERMAKSWEDNPELRKHFEKHIEDEGFKEAIEKLSDEINDLFNHDGNSK